MSWQIHILILADQFMYLFSGLRIDAPINNMTNWRFTNQCFTKWRSVYKNVACLNTEHEKCVNYEEFGISRNIEKLDKREILIKFLVLNAAGISWDQKVPLMKSPKTTSNNQDRAALYFSPQRDKKRKRDKHYIIRKTEKVRTENYKVTKDRKRKIRKK